MTGRALLVDLVISNDGQLAFDALIQLLLEVKLTMVCTAGVISIQGIR